MLDSLLMGACYSIELILKIILSMMLLVVGLPAGISPQAEQK
jgi:hypothetical protein